MPLGSARRFLMEPHGYFDTCAEIFERGPGKSKEKSSVALFTRSKIRCSTFSEWMEIADAATGKTIWRMEARYGDRSVFAPEVADAPQKKGRPAAFLTAVRMYREYEKDPTLMLVHRDKSPAGITDQSSNKNVEVYMCSQLQSPEAGIDPDAELSQFMHDTSTNRQLMPSIEPSKPSIVPTHDESFFFMHALPGDDVFNIQANQTFTTLTLSATQEPSKEDGADGPPVKRVLANVKRTITQEPRKIEVDSALDPALVIALFCAVDQLLISHDAIDYDVEWPADYAYTFDRISSCFGPRKPLRKSHTFLKEEDPPNEPPKESRLGCFGF